MPVTDPTTIVVIAPRHAVVEVAADGHERVVEDGMAILQPVGHRREHAPGPPGILKPDAYTAGKEFSLILEAAHSGANWALTPVYESLAPAVPDYLRAQGADDPDDLTSEVFLRVFAVVGRSRATRHSSDPGCS